MNHTKDCMKPINMADFAQRVCMRTGPVDAADHAATKDEMRRLNDLQDRYAASIVRGMRGRIQTRIDTTTDPIRKEAFQDILNEEISDAERICGK